MEICFKRDLLEWEVGGGARGIGGGEAKVLEDGLDHGRISNEGEHDHGR